MGNSSIMEKRRKEWLRIRSLLESALVSLRERVEGDAALKAVLDECLVVLDDRRALKDEGKLRDLLSMVYSLLMAAAVTTCSCFRGELKVVAKLARIRAGGSVTVEEAVRRARFKALEEGEPCILASTDDETIPMVVTTRRRFEREKPFGLGPEHLIFDSQRGYVSKT